MQLKLLPRKIIGQTIRGIRTRLGMSPADFARSLNVADSGQVAKWERGTVQPDYGTLAKIAAMGMVDALVFHETQLESASPQLTPGEASDLATILARMEGLLTEARTLVDRASRRTAVELLEAASTTTPAQIMNTNAVVLDAEVRLEAKPRSRTASAGRRAAGSQTRGRTTRSRGGGSAGTGASSGSTAKSGASRSSSSRSGNGSSRSRASGSGSSGSSSSKSETSGASA